MADKQDIGALRGKIEALSAENAALRGEGLRGSKTEAMMAFEYERIPNAMKTPRAIAAQRKIATAVMIIVPILLIAVAVIGGLDAYRDHQQQVESRKAHDELSQYLRSQGPDRR